MDLETFREQLVIWGITPNVLMFIGIAALITLFFSLRVVTKWFIGNLQLQDDITSIKKQLSDIQLQLSMPSTVLKKNLTDDIEEAANIKSTTSSTESFRLTNH